ncbi:MAG: hypothetical protein ACK5MW_09480 [Enterococcus sp.]
MVLLWMVAHSICWGLVGLSLVVLAGTMLFKTPNPQQQLVKEKMMQRYPQLAKRKISGLSLLTLGGSLFLGTILDVLLPLL